MSRVDTTAKFSWKQKVKQRTYGVAAGAAMFTLKSVGSREADHESGLLRKALLHAGDDCEKVEVELKRLVGDEARDDCRQVLELRRCVGQTCVAERVANCLPKQLWQRELHVRLYEVEERVNIDEF